MLIDARSVDEGSVIVCDVSVIGSGPAGISLVDRLRSSGLSICLIESGGFEPELRTQRLYRGETVGHQYFRLDSCRWRMFGGSSNRWGGWCCPIDAVDLEGRDDSDWAAWPLDPAELERFNAPAAELLELSSGSFDFSSSTWAGRLPPGLALDGEEFENVLVQYSRPTNFGSRYRQRILDDRHVTTLIHANVTAMDLATGSDRIETLRVRTLDGRSFAVRSRATVLATGGIENARLLLASDGSRPAGLGNEHDLVGRCFMEHVHVQSGHLRLYGCEDRPPLYGQVKLDGATVRGLIAPTADARRRHGLLACSFTVEPPGFGSFGTPFLGWPPIVTFPAARAYVGLRRFAPSPAEQLKMRADRAWNRGLKIQTGLTERIARTDAASELGSMSGRLLSLYARGEQIPNLGSRVSLSNQRDALGVRQARLDWRLSEADTASIASWLVRLDATLRRNSIGQVIMPRDDWKSNIIGGPHHMGTTRMSADPKHGVVDANCRVHTVGNLYIAGSSVFATGGWVNPTFTIVALAVRLADHLRSVLP